VVRAVIVGLGRWGQNLVECTQGKSDRIRFTMGGSPHPVSASPAAKACGEARRVLAVGFNWRFQPALQEIRRMLEDGRIGRLLHIEGNFNGPSVYRFPKEHWRQQREEGPAGGMTGRGVHVVDAMLYLAGHIDSVYAQSYRRALDYGLDDTTSMLFTFRNGGSG